MPACTKPFVDSAPRSPFRSAGAIPNSPESRTWTRTQRLNTSRRGRILLACPGRRLRGYNRFTKGAVRASWHSAAAAAGRASLLQSRPQPNRPASFVSCGSQRETGQGQRLAAGDRAPGRQGGEPGSGGCRACPSHRRKAVPVDSSHYVRVHDCISEHISSASAVRVIVLGRCRAEARAPRRPPPPKFHLAAVFTAVRVRSAMMPGRGPFPAPDARFGASVGGRQARADQVRDPAG